MQISTPLVSVIIPCYNEEKFIGQCLGSIIASEYEGLDVIVVDGMSNDNTRNIIGEYREKYPFVRMIDNPLKIKPRALNIGIEAAQGEIIIRMDAHAHYSPEYISKSVRYLEQYKADNVGGIRKTLPGDDTLLARAIAYSISHPFAAGNATYRTGASEMKWVDTVFGGCYRRELFDKIGFFDEALIRGQDREFNIRLQRSGGKILFAPDIVCHYYARGDLRSFLNWIYVGGLTPFYISRITSTILFSWRNLVPLAFVMTLIGSIVFALFQPLFFVLFLVVVITYLAAAFLSSISVAKKENDFRFMLIMPFVFILTHIFYGIGSFMGLVKPIVREAVWSKV